MELICIYIVFNKITFDMYLIHFVLRLPNTFEHVQN